MVTTIALSDLETIYSELASRHKIPALPDVWNAEETVLHRMVVSLAGILEELKTAGLGAAALAPRKLAIFCDLLRISSARPLALSTHLVIFARRIEVTEGATLTLSSTAATLTVYASEWSGTLKAAAAAAPQSAVTIGGIAKVGVSVRFADGKPAVSDLVNYGMLRQGTQLGSSLDQSALYALLLSTENQQTLAAPMLRHIKAATAHWPERGQLYLQASALLCETDRRARGGYYVPWLAKEVYSDQITAFLASAGRFEDAYEKIRRDNLSLQERADYARMMLRNYNDMQSVATQIRAQTQRNVSSAEEAVEHYREKVIEQHFLVRRAEGDFRRGIERYQEEKKSEAIFEICMATLTLGETVGSIALGVPDPEAAQAAAQVGAEGSKLAKLMRKFAETMRKLAELMKRIGKFTKKVKNLAETIQKIMDAAHQIKNLSGGTPSIPDFPAESEEEQFDIADWDLFAAETAEMIQPAVNEGIDGAAEYKVALLGLAIYGKALNQAQASLVALAQQLSIHLLQEAAARSQAERMRAYIDELERGVPVNQELMRWLYERQLHVKRWLWTAIRNHNDAFRYWALAEPVRMPAFSESVGELAEVLGNIARGEADALESFRGPQNFYAHRVRVDDAAALAGFRKTRSISIEVRLENPTFKNRDRVRLKEIRVWLEGVTAKDSVLLSVGASSGFRDRLRGREYQFAAAAPLELTFEYKQPETILMEGGFADEYRAFYFEPTPFSTWAVAVTDPGLDLNGVRGIVLEFAGNAIPKLVAG
jgi:hypothetical protein